MSAVRCSQKRVSFRRANREGMVRVLKALVSIYCFHQRMCGFIDGFVCSWIIW